MYVGKGILMKSINVYSVAQKLLDTRLLTT